MKPSSKTLLNLVRFALAAAFLGICASAYVRLWASTPNPLTGETGEQVCRSLPGCKSIAATSTYDVQLQRQVILFRVVAEKKGRANGDLRERATLAIDAIHDQQPWYAAWGWNGRRVEVRYE